MLNISGKKYLSRIEIKGFNKNNKGFDLFEIRWRKKLMTSVFLFGYGAVLISSDLNFDKFIDSDAFDKKKK